MNISCRNPGQQNLHSTTDNYLAIVIFYDVFTY